MAQDVSFHLRPIFAFRDMMEVFDVTDSQILLEYWQNGFQVACFQESEDQGNLLFSAPSEDTETSFLLRRTIEFARCTTFMDNRTFLVINDEQRNGTYLRIIRASDERFQNIVERKTFDVDFEGIVSSLSVCDGYAYLTTADSNLTELWKFKVPDPNSSEETIAVEKCGEHRTQEGSRIQTSTTNGRIHVGKLFYPNSGPTKFQMFMGDLRTGHYHTISTAEDDSVQVFGKTALRWSISRHTLGLSVFRLVEGGEVYTETVYAAYIPLPHRQLDVLGPQMEVHIAESGGGRFFLKLRRKILMGYLPGADIPLDALAAARIWRILPWSEQEDLLKRNLLSKRQILLRAMKEEEKKKS